MEKLNRIDIDYGEITAEATKAVAEATKTKRRKKRKRKNAGRDK